MESGIAGILFLAVSLIATIAAIVLSFQTDVKWAAALGVVAIIFAAAGLFFVLRDMNHKKRDQDK